MEFITVEQFREQPEKVQEVFIDWWKGNLSDFDLWFEDFGSDKRSFLNGIWKDCLRTEEEQKNITKKKSCSRKLLFTEGQLRDFIEDRKGQVVEIFLSCGGYSIVTAYRQGEYENLGEDLLKAYWKVACMVAKETLKDEILLGCIKQSLSEGRDNK